MTALVSCIIPVFNGAKYIGEAIASILAQSHKALEILVVDDGSTDNTEAVVRAAHNDVTYLRQANAGPAAARNNAIGHANGEFIALLDSDDRWFPHKLERQLAVFNDNPNVDCVLSRIRLFWEAFPGEAAAYRHDNREESVGFSNSTMLVRRNVFNRVGLFNAALPHAATVEWFAAFPEAGVVVETVPEVLAERRMHENNFSRQRAVSHDEFLHLVKRSMDAKRNRMPRT